MKILSIGNSFSCDAQRYLKRLAASAGYPMKTMNLFIGGCPLRLHYLNALEDARKYTLEFNGESVGLPVSIKEALMSDDWDVVTLQQASPYSPHYESYQPYLNEVAAYVRKYCPHAKLMIHQTWAYEEGAERITKSAHCESAEDMFTRLKEAYSRAAEDIHADGMIPAGEAMWRAVQNGIGQIHRDTFHASYGAGRFLLALTWYGYLTGKAVAEVPFDSFDVPVTPEEREIVVRSVCEILGQA